MLDQRRINPRAAPSVVKDLPAMALIDGDNGLGMVVGAFAMRVAIEKARTAGMAWVSVINSNHFGIAGYYASLGLEENFIGISMTNTPPLVSPVGGRGRRLGTNPIAVAFPADKEPSVIVDMATTAISLGDAEIALRDGTLLPPSCIADAAGEPSQNPRDLFEGGSLLPLGGDLSTGGHKGYCLNAMVDLLCGVFPGASWGPFVPPFLDRPFLSEPTVGRGIGHVFAAISLGAFEDPAHVRTRIDHWVRTMRDTSPTTEGQYVVVPGDPEMSAAASSARLGVALDIETQQGLRRLAEDLNITFEEGF